MSTPLGLTNENVAMTSTDSSRLAGRLDPVYANSRREAWLILGVWALAVTWTLAAYWFLGNRPPDEPLQLLFGMPSWVVWGVALPWALATLFSMWFAQCHMVLDDLGEAEEDAADDEEVRRD